MLLAAGKPHLEVVPVANKAPSLDDTRAPLREVPVE
jgi:hypothetical protein